MQKPVGLVIVSHSERLAAGLCELLSELVSGDIALVAAGGTGDGRIGTSPDLVRSAIDNADRGGGVAVLADIGSAVLSVRTIQEDDPRPDIVLVDAPLVEGAVSAAVTASAGADLEGVAAAAREARQVPKL